MWSPGYVQLSKVTNPPTFCSRFPSMLDDVTLLLACFKFSGPRRHDSNLQVSTQKHQKNTPRQQSPLHLFGQSHDQKAKPSNGGSETPSHSPQLGERSDMMNPKGVNLQNACSKSEFCVKAWDFWGHKLNLTCKSFKMSWNCLKGICQYANVMFICNFVELRK